MARRRFIYYTVETSISYTKYETKAEALEAYKSDTQDNKELFGVDAYGLCNTICKKGKFAYEK